MDFLNSHPTFTSICIGLLAAALWITTQNLFKAFKKARSDFQLMQKHSKLINHKLSRMRLGKCTTPEGVNELLFEPDLVRVIGVCLCESQVQGISKSYLLHALKDQQTDKSFKYKLIDRKLTITTELGSATYEYDSTKA